MHFGFAKKRIPNEGGSVNSCAEGGARTPFRQAWSLTTLPKDT